MMSRWMCYVILAAAAAGVCKGSITEYRLDERLNKTNVISDELYSYYWRTALIGGYFDAHFPNDSTSNGCGRLNRQGLLQVEAMRYALNQVNKRNILPYGWSLSYWIVDTCSNLATLRRSFSISTNWYSFAATVGPPTSEEASTLSTVATLSRSVMVSPSATSSLFDDRDDYENVFRMVPSDAVEVTAFIDICLQFNWTYVSIVYTPTLYGHRLKDEFVDKGKKKNICVKHKIELPTDASSSKCGDILRKLTENGNPKVVFLFTDQPYTQNFLEVVNKIGNDEITWIATTSWTASKDFVKNMKETAKGSLILSHSDIEDANFKNYFLNLTVKDANYTWFREFWEEIFNCTFSDPSGNQGLCTGNEKLNETQLDWEFLSIKPVINAVESIVCALRKALLQYCSVSSYYCSRYSSTKKRIRDIFKNGESKCDHMTDSVNTNKQGFVDRNIVILNFDGEKHKKVGIWRHNTSVNGRSLQFTRNIVWKNGTLPVASCSKPCRNGEIRSPVSSDSCCFTCKPCGKGKVNRNNTCQPCGRYEWPDFTGLKCKIMEMVRAEKRTMSGMATITVLFIGLVLNTFVVVVFLKNRNLRIIKATSRELSFIILMALYLCFICPFVYLVKPSKAACGAQRFIIGMSLTGCYTPLMLKTNRIYRIFKAAQVTISQPLFVSPKSQVFICTGLLGLQLLLGMIWLVAVPPTVEWRLVAQNTKVAQICKSDSFYFVVNLLPCLVVMSICTVYAFLTRKFPSNFNEAQSIGVTMYMSCFLWGIFIPVMLLLDSNDEYVLPKMYVCANFTTIIGFVTLIGLFGPKVVKILCHTGTVEPKTERFSQFHGEFSLNQTVLNRPLSVSKPMQAIPESETVAAPSAKQ